MSRILVVEDENHIAQGLRFNLEAEGHSVILEETGEEALVRLLTQREDFDLLVLDVMLPGKDGFTVAHELRQAGHFIPLLMLTARSRPEDVLKGFSSGADDYLAKPFNLDILVARIASLLRRRSWAQNNANSNTVEESFAFNGITVDFQKLQLRKNGQTFQLTLM
ncbi:MAG TPA: response regulator transcription factor, partial [Terriglobales bacterium]|nr:response regulator transcription factor [Terriglobales bacterium]